ncbi:hypothetical protein bas01_0061 [Escherichia phage AugustePiccard]|uniref:Uncharacterized protein n=1 Tax=Escherichia phage AugustePiccard TaxID=2851954 RepID=A0AAE7VP35_9CAUD|nr:hypothetical protein bas01_0061 [Escherichia phage AugustePiccard]
MKIKLVKFKDIDMDGSNETDYGLFIGNVYDVVDRDIAMGIRTFTVINSIREPINLFEDEVEIQL